MTLRFVTIIVSILDFLAWIFIASATFLSGSDQATKGLDNVAGMAVTALILVTGVPALVLALKARGARTALALALAFPATFAVLFIALVVTFN
ncbi:MAG: hypothetical protein ACM3IH_13385 [Sphingobacteriales bacterium]|jgi:hypothetical protein